jgi:hypothetical protein
MKFTRREVAVAISASAALLAQTPGPPLPQNPDEELKAVRDQLAQSAQQLAKFDLPMSTEPAAHFKA